MQDIAPTLSALAALLWPVLAVGVVVPLIPALRDVIRSRNFTVKIGGLEITAQQATDQLRVQLQDLQAQVIALRRQGGLVGPEGEADQPAAALASSDGGAILWVDDHPSNNALQVAQLQQLGYEVITAQSTREGLGTLQAGRRVTAIISDITRIENGVPNQKAGLELLAAVRQAGFGQPFMLYASSRSVASRRQQALELGADGATSSPTELLAWVASAAARPPLAVA